MTTLWTNTHWCTFIFRIASRSIITTKLSPWKQNTWSDGSLWLRLRRVKWTRIAQSVRTYIAQLRIPVRTEHDGMTLMLMPYFLHDISEPADASCLNYRVLSNRRNISGQFGRASFDLKIRRMTLLHHAPTFTFLGTPLVYGGQRQAAYVGRSTAAETSGWFTS